MDTPDVPAPDPAAGPDDTGDTTEVAALAVLATGLLILNAVTALQVLWLIAIGAVAVGRRITRG